MGGVLADVFFEPYHVVPVVEFVAALVEFTYQSVAKPLVEAYAVVG